MNHQLHKKTPDVGTGIVFVIFVHYCLCHKELYSRFPLFSLLKHSHETRSLEEENTLITLVSCSFPVIFTACYKDRGLRCLRWVFFNHSLQLCHKQLSFKFKFEYSETRLSLLNFSFVHSSKTVHKCLSVNSPINSANSLLSVNQNGGWCSLESVIEVPWKTRRVGRWERASCWGKAEHSPWEVRHQLIIGTQSHKKPRLLDSAALRSTYLFIPNVGSNARTTLNLRGITGRMDYGQKITVGSSSAKAETQVRDLNPAEAWSHTSPVQRVHIHHQVPAW